MDPQPFFGSDPSFDCPFLVSEEKAFSLFNKAAILIVLVGMASFADAYWIEPNWLKTEHWW